MNELLLSFFPLRMKPRKGVNCFSLNMRATFLFLFALIAYRFFFNILGNYSQSKYY